MGKILFWLVVIFAALMVARMLTMKARSAKQPPMAAPKPRPSVSGASESMVRCAHCGIHLPRSEAYMQQGQTWCSSEHARLGARV
ncbi:hypothetical protein H0484_14345 [Pusillimonas sp. CC-YST705]|uniref:MYND finger n=1 Tax=Mesopusillimonas faecipullorum TaxID=2755040 RepID=A0ABS8CGI2_9BURK|nr:PP0621 family protein [Mesopusillimonas faecipullorum]MCB5364924.1 hypothetical protein [Mesopusillimonas faecipullorum]